MRKGSYDDFDRQGNQKACENKELPLITPFDEDSLQREPYVLSIGNTLTIFKKEIRCLNLSDHSEIDDIYEEIDIPLSGYVLSPKDYVLATLKERITIPEYITAHIRPRFEELKTISTSEKLYKKKMQRIKMKVILSEQNSRMSLIVMWKKQ